MWREGSERQELQEEEKWLKKRRKGNVKCRVQYCLWEVCKKKEEYKRKAEYSSSKGRIGSWSFQHSLITMCSCVQEFDYTLRDLGKYESIFR